MVCVAGRDPARTRLAASFIGAEIEPVRICELPGKASRFLIAVSDPAILPVAEALAPCVSGTEIALHTCGAKDIEDLRPLRLRGISCGTLHPLQTVCGPEQGAWGAARCRVRRLRGRGGGSLGEQIVRRLDGQMLRIPPAARSLYHAAAVMASNYLAALIDAAQSLMAASSGVDRDTALRALAPLVRTAVDNIFERGPVAALTGPIERGAAATVRSHLDALPAVPPHIQDLYRGAGLHTLDLARRKGLSPLAIEPMKALLLRAKAG